MEGMCLVRGKKKKGIHFVWGGGHAFFTLRREESKGKYGGESED